MSDHARTIAALTVAAGSTELAPEAGKAAGGSVGFMLEGVANDMRMEQEARDGPAGPYRQMHGEVWAERERKSTEKWKRKRWELERDPEYLRLHGNNSWQRFMRDKHVWEKYGQNWPGNSTYQRFRRDKLFHETLAQCPAPPFNNSGYEALVPRRIEVLNNNTIPDNRALVLYNNTIIPDNRELPAPDVIDRTHYYLPAPPDVIDRPLPAPTDVIDKPHYYLPAPPTGIRRPLDTYLPALDPYPVPPDPPNPGPPPGTGSGSVGVSSGMSGGVGGDGGGDGGGGVTVDFGCIGSAALGAALGSVG